MYKAVKSTLVGIAAAMIALSAPQAAEPLVDEKAFPGEFSANVALVSEYYFRGISQTDDTPAVQGGFDWSVPVSKNGLSFYLGIWGSNVDFNEVSGVDGASLEADVYGGLSGSIGDVGWDVGVIYYAYPGAASNLNYDFWEGAIALSYDFGYASATASVNYSPDNFGASGEAWYPKLALDVPVGKYLTLSAHVAKQYIEKNSVFGQPDYVDWSVGGTVNAAGFDLNLTYSDTDLSSSECSDACGMVLFSISRSF
ncbi:MAG: TorF family putative porin [Alphaproteobacteria bacterium]